MEEMKQLQLKRIANTNDGTFGVLLDEGVPFCLTVERPWLDNAVGKSCIPDGTYICRRVESPKFGWTFEVTDVEGRTHILFHKGNIMDDSHGCIVVGERFEPFRGRLAAVMSSGDAFEEFMERLCKVQEFELTISWMHEFKSEVLWD